MVLFCGGPRYRWWQYTRIRGSGFVGKASKSLTIWEELQKYNRRRIDAVPYPIEAFHSKERKFTFAKSRQWWQLSWSNRMVLFIKPRTDNQGWTLKGSHLRS